MNGAEKMMSEANEVDVIVTCECYQCIKDNNLKHPDFEFMPLSLAKMILCPDCGKKRCPKASNHRYDCTGSNETGQAGSIYT